MVENKSCNRDDCPPTHIQHDSLTNCVICNDVVHLMCIGIQRKAKDVLFHPNVKVICNKCLDPKTKSSQSSATNKNSPIVKQTLLSLNNKSNARQSSIIEYAMATKIDEMVSLLRDVQNKVNDTNEKVSSQSETSKSYSDVLKELKELTVSTNGKLNNNNLSYAAVTRRNIAKSNTQSPFPNQTPRKRKREDDIPTTKLQFKSRTLMSGTGTNADHGLGDSVPSSRSNSGNSGLGTGQKRVSPYAHLKKSIYISRLQPSVKAEDISGYIKAKLTEIDEKDFLLRMLVKKDQKMDELTFISYRLACTEEHYSKFMDSSFWPQHVMIGEFIERERRQVNVGDFIVTQSTGENPTPNDPNLPINTVNANKNTKIDITEISMETNE